MSQPISLLLDKSVVRHLLVGLDRELIGQTPTVDKQRTVLTLFQQIVNQTVSTYIVRETWNILMRAHDVDIVRLFLSHVRTLNRGKYFKRWARRLTEHSFTFEDAKILSIGSFGIDVIAERLGVDIVVTYDNRMLRNYKAHFALLAERFDRMTRQLPLPCYDAGLPEVLTPEQTLRRLVVV